MTFFDDHWLWIAAGLLLLGLEIIASGIFLFWVGLAAIATGLILWIIPLSLTAQLMLFAFLGLGAILLGRSIQKSQSTEATDSPFLNKRSQALLGRTLVLETAISNGAGSVRMDDSVWRVIGPELAAGVTVRVTSVDGSTLVVEPV
jgi:inner membrane protein